MRKERQLSHHSNLAQGLGIDSIMTHKHMCNVVAIPSLSVCRRTNRAICYSSCMYSVDNVAAYHLHLDAVNGHIIIDMVH